MAPKHITTIRIIQKIVAMIFSRNVLFFQFFIISIGKSIKKKRGVSLFFSAPHKTKNENNR